MRDGQAAGGGGGQAEAFLQGGVEGVLPRRINPKPLKSGREPWAQK